MSEREHLGRKGDSLIFAHMKELVVELYHSQGADSARNLLIEFHVERLGDLPRERWDKFLKVAKERLNLR